MQIKTELNGGEVIMNWANTRVLGSKQQIVYPESIVQVSEVVHRYKHVRPVGSRLTYESLTVADSTPDSVLIDVSKLTGLVAIDIANNKAEFWASTTIDEISNTLKLYGKYLDCSPGVIGIQTIAGASGTGTHGQGLYANALCDAIIGGQMVVGDGSIVRVRSRKNNGDGCSRAKPARRGPFKQHRTRRFPTLTRRM